MQISKRISIQETRNEYGRCYPMEIRALYNWNLGDVTLNGN